MGWLRGIGLGTMALAAACGSCDTREGTLVPFGIDAGRQHPAASEFPDGPQDAPFAPVEGQRLPPGTHALAVEGAELSTSEQEIAALLHLDMDGDGDRDALLLVRGEEGHGLTLGMRQGPEFDLRPLGNFAAPAACTLDDVSMRTIAAHLAVVKVGFGCPTDSSGDTWGALWILSLDRTPRVLERITLLPEQGRAPGALSVSATARDQDEDGHVDVLVDLTLNSPGQSEPVTTTLTWLDRPSGLARIPGQPEGTLVNLSDRAKSASTPSTAAQLARAALALHAALCRGDSATRIRLGGADGLDCGVSAGAGRAAAVLSTSLARQGDLFGAIDAFMRVRLGGLRVAGSDEREAERAILELAQTPTTREGPSTSPVAGPDVRLSSLYFADTRTVVVSGTPPMLWNLETDEVASAPGKERNLLIRDPSGRFAVVNVRRRCEGYVLTIVRTEDVSGHLVLGQPVSEPVLEPKAPPLGARCPDLPGAFRQQDGGWQIIGWAPQGVVATRGTEVRLVPLTNQAEAVGEARPLETALPLPAPLPAGRLARSGRAHASITNFGITVVELSPQGRAVLLRPEGWNLDTASDVAVSDDGATVAYLDRGRARLMEIDWSSARLALPVN